MFTARFSIATCLLLIGAITAQAEDAPSKSTKRKQSIDELVSQLRSPNAPPPISQGGHYKLPETFDRAGQAGVHAAMDELKQAGPAAFPALIEHFDDLNYSTTIASPLSDFWHNRRVAWVAREIIASQVRPIGPWHVADGDPRRLPPRPNYEWVFLKDKKTAQDWWKERQDRSLRELQLEALQWTLTEEEKKPDDYSESERNFLKKQIEKLQKEALPAGNASGTYRIGEDY